VLKLTDKKGRNLLSATCYKGNYRLINYLLSLHKEHRVPARVLDISDNDAVELACIRGFNLSDEEDQVKIPIPENEIINETQKYYYTSHRF
jgi:hypothetical protein